MTTDDPKLRAAYEKILRSDIFTTTGPEIDLCAALLELCDAIDETEVETEVWACWGDCEAAGIGDILAGAWWALSEWHGGQYSEEYEAMSRVSDIYKPAPGADGLESDSTERDAYDAIETHLHYKLDPNAFRR